jgi:hypothetical protein
MSMKALIGALLLVIGLLLGLLLIVLIFGALRHGRMRGPPHPPGDSASRAHGHEPEAFEERDGHSPRRLSDSKEDE